jgi:quinol monooxygenase YgiN
MANGEGYRMGAGKRLTKNIRSCGALLTNHSRLDAARHCLYSEGMDRLSGFVSLHPYFKVPPDKMPLLKAILPEFAGKTRNEAGNLFYEFTINGDEVFCREGYVNAEALLAHLDNVGAMLAEALKMADLIRLEVHGPAAELQKLREPLAHLHPVWFELHR